jgi:hypothetical protein
LSAERPAPRKTHRSGRARNRDDRTRGERSPPWRPPARTYARSSLAIFRTATRVPVFTLDLSAATVAASGHTVKVGNIDVRLTAVAAGALNQSLGTHVFIGGLDLGTARTTLRT